VGIHWLLHSSCCFLNTSTAITRQLIPTARTLEAEWRQVCGEVWVWGQGKMSQVLGAFGLLDFTMLLPISPCYCPFHHVTAHFTMLLPISPCYCPFHHVTTHFTMLLPISPCYCPFHHVTAHFTMLLPILPWRIFWNLLTVYFFNFPNFFLGCSKPWLTETMDTGVRL